MILKEAADFLWFSLCVLLCKHLGNLLICSIVQQHKTFMGKWKCHKFNKGSCKFTTKALRTDLSVFVKNPSSVLRRWTLCRKNQRQPVQRGVSAQSALFVCVIGSLLHALYVTHCQSLLSPQECESASLIPHNKQGRIICPQRVGWRVIYFIT